MKKILIADQVDEECITIFKSAGYEVDYSIENSPDLLLKIIHQYNCLVVRSSTKVSSELIDKMDSMEIIGRAGAGLDNIDVPAATRKGILVMNTPGGNTISAAEHTLALLLATCRKVPQANHSMKNEIWDRSQFKGTELQGKTLGLIGLGKIGKEVALRAKAFGMSIITYDPVISEEIVSGLGIQLVGLEEIWNTSDFISIHTPLNDKTKNLISYKELSKCKPGVGIINCARGGIINEKDLLKALNTGIVSAAALDVFEKEPPDFFSELLKHPSVVCTPHLGASTIEAQKKVAVQIAEQIVNYFQNRTISGAVNAPVLKEGIPENIKAFVSLSDVLGRLLSQLRTGSLKKLQLTLFGEDLQNAGKLLMTALLKGFLSEELDDPVNFINAPVIAEEMGIVVEVTFSTGHKNYFNLVNVSLITDKKVVELEGTVFGNNDLRIVKFNNYFVEFKPEGNILIYRNIDKPGMLAAVSKVLAEANINIANLALGRISEENDALTIINLDCAIDDTIRKSISGIDGIYDIFTVRIEF